MPGEPTVGPPLSWSGPSSGSSGLRASDADLVGGLGEGPVAERRSTLPPRLVKPTPFVLSTSGPAFVALLPAMIVFWTLTDTDAGVGRRRRR